MDKRESQENLVGALAGLSNDVAAAVQSSGAVTARDVENAIDGAFARQNAIDVNERMMGVFSGNTESIANLLVKLNRDQRTRTERERQARSRNDSTTLSMLLDDLAEFEAGLAADYGENFAENLFSDLNAKGLISDEDHKEVMSIRDEAERKKAVAVKIQEGLDDGTIKPEDLEGHPWSQEWLEKHKRIEEAYQREAAQGLSGEKSASELSTIAREIAKEQVLENAPNMRSAFEEATAVAEQSEQSSEATPQIAAEFNPDEFSI